LLLVAEDFAVGSHVLFLAEGVLVIARVDDVLGRVDWLQALGVDSTCGSGLATDRKWTGLLLGLGLCIGH
jgi:hypothetical protein